MRLSRGLHRPVVPPGTRGPLLAVATAAALLVVAVGLVVAGTSSAFAVDDSLLAAAGGWSPRLWTYALPVDFLGEPLGVVLMATVIGGACLVLARWRLALLTVAAQGVIWGTIELVKPVIGRTIHGAHLAYPSGHTAGTAAFALTVGLLVVSMLRLERAAALAVAFVAFAVGGLVAAWAQTVLGAHYATDTIGGLALTLALVAPLGVLIDVLGGWLLHRAGGDADGGNRVTAQPPAAEVRGS